MKVKELIAALKKCRQNAEVTIVVDWTIEDELGYNPRVSVAGVDDAIFVDDQTDTESREAILYLNEERFRVNKIVPRF